MDDRNGESVSSFGYGLSRHCWCWCRLQLCLCRCWHDIVEESNSFRLSLQLCGRCSREWCLGNDDSVLAHCCRQKFLTHTTAVRQLPWRSWQVSICCWDVAGNERVAHHTIAAARCLLEGCSCAFVGPGDHEMLHRSAQHRGVGCACSLADWPCLSCSLAAPMAT